MLWEPTEPGQALRDRFGHDGFDDAAAWLTKVLLRSWAIDVRACDRIVISDRNALAWVRTDRGALVAKWSRAEDQFDRLAAVADLLPVLHDRGVPVALPLASIDARPRVVVDSGSSPMSMTVQSEVDGQLLDVVDEAAVRRAGACLATLHRSLAGHEDDRLTGPAPGRPLDLGRRIGTWLEQADPGRAPAASARLREQIASLPPIDREPQLIHTDYRASNVITAGSEVVAVIDFDGVAWDHCVSDLAFAFVYLGTHFTDWRPTPPKVREALLEGYQSVRPLSGLELRWLDALVLSLAIGAIPAGDDPAGWAAAADDVTPAG